jgi:hypothetical protein
MLIMKIVLLPDAVEPGFQCVKTHWIRGFMAFHRVRHVQTVMLMYRCDLSPVSGTSRPVPAHWLTGSEL